jgi:hypothetical protein
MSFMKTSIFIVSFITLTGCASTGIMKTGGDRYMISKTSLQVGFGAPTAVYADISQEAEVFCANQNKVLDVVNTDIKHPALGRPGSATLEFRCKEKGQ